MRINLYKIALLGAVLLAIFQTGCKKDHIKDPEFGTGDYPRIYDETNTFFSPIRVISMGETTSYNNLSYSPAGKVKIAWKVDDEVKSTDTAFSFTPTTGGEFTISLEVAFNGLKSTRSSKVLVKPDTYTLKPYDKVVLAYLSENGTAAAIDFETITHVACQYGRVAADGGLDVSAGESNSKTDEVVARAHLAGRQALLGIAGRLSGMDGWALYGASDFGDAIRKSDMRAILVANIKAYVTAKKLDGVDIMMSDINVDPYIPHLTSLPAFISELKAALPADALITVTVAPSWQHWSYPDLSAADWVHVRAFEDGLHVGEHVPRGQPSGFDYMKTAADIWKNFHLPAEKIVIGIPAFGLRYNEIDDEGNNLGWGSYDYITFKNILELDPTAGGKEKIDHAFGVYYNGVPLVKQKAEYIKTSSFKGAYLWAADYDIKGDGSLLKTMYTALK